MPADYSLDLPHRLVRSRAWGSLTDTESHLHYVKLAADPAFEPSFRQLCDLSEVTAIEASPDTLRTLARLAVFAPGTRRAFVANEDEHFGLARMLQMFCEIEGTEVGVFRNIRAAEDWLGLPTTAPPLQAQSM